MMEEAPPQPAVPIVAQAPFWSSILKSQPPPKPVEQNDVTSADKFVVGSCKSSKGVAVAVVDANAVIEGGQSLSRLADRFVSVPEVMSEIRDPAARRRLDFLPFPIETVEPTPESLSKVTKFAKATGDIQTLSDVDIKLIALTYTLEAQIHGTHNLRDCPPPVQTVNVKRLPEKDMPGWGTNVPNLEEWEALEQEGENASNAQSKILPLKDLNLNVIPESDLSGEALPATADNQSENQEDFEGGLRKNIRYPPKKKDLIVEGKKMVADGIDASKGEVDAGAGDWIPAVSRSTHRKFLRRKARRESNEALFEKECEQEPNNTVENNQTSTDFSLQPCSGNVKSVSGTFEESGVETASGLYGTEDLPPLVSQLSLQEESCIVLEEGKELDLAEGDENDVTVIGEELDVSSQTNGSVDGSCLDDESSEQSWMVRSLSESTVACVTSDFAMQNVILQMGLRLLAPGGMQIRQLQRWILKCHACYAVTAEMGRIFCPNCGNGGTLRRVAVTVNENGIIMSSHQPRIRLRGTKFSLPSPQGGRDAITKNLILREDQLPQKYLHPKTKKKTNKEIEFMTPDNIFIHHSDKRSPFQPPVRKAMAVFSGKRNPNDNHYSRSRH